MLRLAIIFFIIALIAGLFGFTGIYAAGMYAAKIFFYIFVVLFLIFLVLGMLGGRGAPPV